ncbi:uncharacterized protein V6R79_000756 [Siganus canaliculatus]
MLHWNPAAGDHDTNDHQGEWAQPSTALLQSSSLVSAFQTGPSAETPVYLEATRPKTHPQKKPLLLYVIKVKKKTKAETHDMTPPSTHPQLSPSVRQTGRVPPPPSVIISPSPPVLGGRRGPSMGRSSR